MIVKLHGKEIDLSKAVPLKVGDWRKLKKLGINPHDFIDPRSFSWDINARMLLYILQKADPSVTEEDIDNLLPDDPIINQTFTASGGKQVAIEKAGAEKAENPS